MKYIAHRGLLKGPDKALENKPEQIIDCLLNKEYDCEIDVHFIKNEWWLGHDEPQYKVEEDFLLQKGLWIHCKNLEALERMQYLPKSCNYFWHQEDDFTLTSQGQIWTFPGNTLTESSVAVIPESSTRNWEYAKESKLFGVCSDYLEAFINETSPMPVWTTSKLF
jgi:hypothetical protein